MATKAKASVAATESAAACLAPDLHSNRPVTPPELRRFRKLSNNAPGVHVSHWGLADSKVDQTDRRFGLSSAELAHESGRPTDVATTFNAHSVPPTKLGAYIQDKQESIYASHKREPLAQPPALRDPLPVFTNQDDFKFGRKTTQDVSSGTLIYPEAVFLGTRKDLANIEEERQVTQPVHRNYDWQKAGVDPNSFRFGRNSKEHSSALTAVALALKEEEIRTKETQIGLKRVEDFRATKHCTLGHVKDLKRQEEAFQSGISFGASSVTPDEWGAKECIRGAYSAEEQKPDADLGTINTKIHKLNRPETVDPNKSFGCATVRSDRAPPARRSVADFTNYGDEKGALDLLYPAKFSFDGLSSDDFNSARHSDDLRSIFETIGYALTDAEHGQVMAQASKDGQTASVESYRAALNFLKFKIPPKK